MLNTYEKSRAWMYRNARPLDLARWQYHFEGGSKQNALEALAAFQNADGGFGHAIEPDVWNPNSSPFASSEAINYLYELDALDSQSPIVQRLLSYFESCSYTAPSGWQVNIESHNDYPHAPWWTYSDESAKPENWHYNPTATIVGFILRTASAESALYQKAFKILDAMLENLSTAQMIEDHEVACYVRLYNWLVGSSLEAKISETKARIQHFVDKGIERDTAKWSTDYVTMPSMYLETAKSAFIAGNEEIIRSEVRHLLESQNTDGSWNILWRWRDYEKEFAVATMWWKGRNMVGNMRFLKSLAQL